MANKHPPATKTSRRFHSPRRPPSRTPWEGVKEGAKDEVKRWLGSLSEQVSSQPRPAPIEIAPGSQQASAQVPQPAQNLRFGSGKGFSEKDQTEIKRLRGQLRRLKSISERQKRIYEESKRAEEERRRVEEEEERMEKEKKPKLPGLGALDWFKNLGQKSKKGILGFVKRKKKAEFKPGGYRG
jgi:hypothetical protein